jgi:hypothetical protein
MSDAKVYSGLLLPNWRICREIKQKEEKENREQRTRT